MPQSDFIAAKLFRHIIQCALPHFCTERAGIFFFSLIKNDFADIGFHNGIMHTQLIAECLYAVIACAGQTERDGNCLQLKPLGIEALLMLEGDQKTDAVFAAGNTDRNFIAFLYHAIIIYCAAHIA